MSSARPLLVTTDPELAEDVFRLAAAAGAEAEHARDPAALGGAWRSASAVLLDGAAAAAVAALGPPRRRGVLVLCRGPAEQLWQAAFELGADHVVRLPEGERTVIDFLAEAADAAPARDGRVLAVLGGRGGAGASVLAGAAAVSAAHRGGGALLVDCDPWGGGLDLAVGAEGTGGLRWSGLAVRAGRLAAGALHEALPGRRVGGGSLAVLACDRDAPSTGLTPQAVRAVLEAGRRAGDTVVCDLPRAPSEPAAAALRHADLVVLVVPAEVRACAAAARVLASVREITACPLRLVVRGPAPGGLRPSDVAAALGVPALAHLRPHPGLPGALDRGGLRAVAGRSALGRVAHRLLAELDRSDPVRAEEVA
ncbi:septum site-determining protein Ssd [Saccharopolyspora sp. CA-218241]|uniref:septum site-determining protein Ssd n=1 Tax=Saccharopolyspora sp. CA-218241 TaxID=3240027 RepID=UPI003D99DFBC